MRIPGTNIAWSGLVSGIAFGIGVCGLIAILIINMVKKKKLESKE